MTDRSTVIVVGTGAAGLAAALAAAETGAEVHLLEKSDVVGGTTALSGGVAWLPGHHRAPPDIPPDSREDALAYIRSLALGDADAELIDVFVDDAPRVARAVEDLSSIVWQAIPYPDYHAERPGGRAAGGRSIEPSPLTVSPELRERIRVSPALSVPVTFHEAYSGQIDGDQLTSRIADGTLTLGRALVGGLLEACLARGVQLQTGVRVRHLLREGDDVVGVRTESDLLRGSVVLATGGFERDPSLAAAFLRGPMLAPTGSPTAQGDGLRMAIEAGADLGNMSEAWWCPAFSVPGETSDGAPYHRLLLFERAQPGCIMVDGTGHRFVDEAQNYNDLGRALQTFEPSTYSFPRVPCWLVFDQANRDRSPMQFAGIDPEGWLYQADDVAGLAELIGVPPGQLVATIERFNEQAAQERDDDFGRGTFAHDLFLGRREGGHPTLAPLQTGPYYAVRVVPGCLGTKGGPRIDTEGRVLRASGDGVIRGLHAAGNAAASPFGMAYPGAGGTIGAALVFGMRAGATAAKG